MRGLTREQGIALLDRAAEVGLLTAYGEGYYAIHPALPWYFTELFTTVYGPAGSAAAQQATRAYTTAMRNLGNYLTQEYVQAVGMPFAVNLVVLLGTHLVASYGPWSVSTPRTSQDVPSDTASDVGPSMNPSGMCMAIIATSDPRQ